MPSFFLFDPFLKAVAEIKEWFHSFFGSYETRKFASEIYRPLGVAICLKSYSFSFDWQVIRFHSWTKNYATKVMLTCLFVCALQSWGSVLKAAVKDQKRCSYLVSLECNGTQCNGLRIVVNRFQNGIKSFLKKHSYWNSPGPCIMRIHLVQNSTSARLWKTLEYSLSDKFALSE